MTTEQRYLGEVLARRGVLPAARLEELLATQKEKGVDLIDLLVSTRTSDESTIGRALADEVGVRFVESLDASKIPSDVATRLPITWAKQHRVVVVGEDARQIHVVAADPLDLAAQDDVRAMFGKPVDLTVAPGSVIVDAINSFYERLNTANEDLEKEEEDTEELTDIIDQSEDDAKIIRWVNSLFAEASKRRASDIHIEPEEREVMVRYRIDGELHEARRAGRAVMPNIIARVKIMAGLNIAEKRLPQDASR
jgi:general secretion pathway protein E